MSPELRRRAEDVLRSYNLFLGRMPESTAICIPKATQIPGAMIFDFLTSDEFKVDVVSPIIYEDELRREIYDMPISEQMVSWSISFCSKSLGVPVPRPARTEWASLFAVLFSVSPMDMLLRAAVGEDSANSLRSALWGRTGSTTPFRGDRVSRLMAYSHFSSYERSFM
jgi:hypothetical protein